MQELDTFVERSSRTIAGYSSRRGVLAAIGRLLIGGALLVPVLPVARAFGATPPSSEGDKESEDCDYWKYCGMAGSLCSCCGGSSHQCPVGTEPSKVHWVGTCKSASDGKNYIVAYHDCCGQAACGKCWCENEVGNRPGYVMGLHGNVDWCMANNTLPAMCTTATIMGLVAESS